MNSNNSLKLKKRIKSALGKGKECKVVTIGGGTGTFVVLSGLKNYPVKISAIVSMADDGGSTGILREEFGMLPPGDIRRALVALSQQTPLLAKLFSYRFFRGSFKGHSFGNLLLTVLTKLKGGFEKAVEEAGKILHIKGEVIPVTLDNAKLYAQLEDGEVIKGETNIDIPKHNGKLRIEKVWLKPLCRANPKAISAIKIADLIILGPGDLYTSTIPNLLVKGMPEAIRKSRAKRIFVCNLMTKFGETTGFMAEDFVSALESYLGKNVLNYVLLNNRKPSSLRLKKYAKEKAELVRYKKEDFQGKNYKVIEGDFLREKGFIRHSSQKLAKILTKLCKK